MAMRHRQPQMSVDRLASRHRSTRSRWTSSAVCLVVGATTSVVTHAQHEVVIEVSGHGMPGGLPMGLFDMDSDAAPMGLRDVASVFPFSGPFAVQEDGAPGDRFLHQALDGVDRSFLEQLMPVLQSRFQDQVHPCEHDVQKLCPHSDAPLHCLGTSRATISPGCTQEIKHAVPFVCSEQIQAFCSDDIEKGVLQCLEEHGPQLGPDCSDAIIAAKHAISSLAASQKKASNAMNGKKEKPHHAQPGGKQCPHGWSGPEANGCCTKRWAPACAALCSKDQCSSAHWEFQWLDFRTHPYTCCPTHKPANQKPKYVGGQPLCPSGWKTEPHSEGTCCRRGWSWDCGHSCAEARCDQQKGFAWAPVNEGKDQYRCCPHGHPLLAHALTGKGHEHKGLEHKGVKAAKVAHSQDAAAATAAMQDSMPEGLGSSLVGAPVNLATGGWTTGAFVLALGAIILLARRYLLSQDTPSHSSSKEQ